MSLPPTLAESDAEIDALPMSALADEVAALNEWAPADEGRTPPAHRIATLRACRAAGMLDEEIRERHATWWAVGRDSSTDRCWHRDRARATATEIPMGRGTNEVVRERREALREVLPATAAEVRERLEVYAGLGVGAMTDDMKAIGAVRGPGKVWAIGDAIEAAPRRRREAPVVEVSEEDRQPLRPSLAADAIRYIREGAEGPGVELPAEYCRALATRLGEVGL